MASPLPGMAPSAGVGGQALDAAPPSPAEPEEGSKDAVRGLTRMGLEIDRALKTLSESLPEGGNGLIAKARQLIQQALADYVAESGESGAGKVGSSAKELPAAGLYGGGPR